MRAKDTFILRDDLREARQKAFIGKLEGRVRELQAAKKPKAVAFVAQRIAELKSPNPFAARLRNKAKALRQSGDPRDQAEAERLEAKANGL